MKRIGRVLHISSSGKAVIRAESIPKIGDTVLDEKLRPVGKVFDVIGSVASPYVEVTVDIKTPRRLVNHVLYFNPSSKPRSKRKRRRK
mgnify:CR=1 FL=1